MHAQNGVLSHYPLRYHHKVAVGDGISSNVLDERREALVQPEVAPPLERHEIAEPLDYGSLGPERKSAITVPDAQARER